MDTTNLLKIQQLVAANPDKWEAMVELLQETVAVKIPEPSAPLKYQVTDRDIGAVMWLWDSCKFNDTEIRNVGIISGLDTDNDDDPIYRTTSGVPWYHAAPYLGDIKLHMIKHKGGLISPRLNLTLNQVLILKTDRGIGIYNQNPSVWRNVTHYRVITLLPIEESDYV